MRRALHALFALALCGMAGGAAHADATPSRLEALATADDGRGWEAVGRLELGGGSFCTGALVGADLVLTAAHCLFDEDSGARIGTEAIEFRAGFRNGRAEAYRGIRRAVVHPEYRYLGPDRMDRVAMDVALLQLDRPIRSAQIRPFAMQEGLSRGQRVGVVSYAKGRAEAPSLQEVCHVLERAGGVVMLSCSVDFGASGAPIFADGAEGPEIVSVVSAKAEAEGRPVALASAFERTLGILQEALAAAPEGVLNRGVPLSERFGDGRESGRLGAKFVRP